MIDSWVDAQPPVLKSAPTMLAAVWPIRIPYDRSAAEFSVMNSIIDLRLGKISGQIRQPRLHSCLLIESPHVIPQDEVRHLACTRKPTSMRMVALRSLHGSLSQLSSGVVKLGVMGRRGRAKIFDGQKARCHMTTTPAHLDADFHSRSEGLSRGHPSRTVIGQACKLSVLHGHRIIWNTV